MVVFSLMRVRVWIGLEGGRRDVPLMYELNLHCLWRPPVQGHVHSRGDGCRLLIAVPHF